MKEFSELHVNSRVEIEVDDFDYGGKYLSRVMEITKKEVIIMALTHKGHIVPVRPKTPVAVLFIGERAMYSFQTIVLRRFKEPIPALSLKIPTKVFRIQRREYVRLQLQLPLNYRVIKNYFEISSSADEPLTQTWLVDISGGGAKFLSDAPIEEGTYIELQLGIEEIGTLPIVGKVVRYEKRDDNLYEIGVSYDSIPSSLQDQIVSWIFEKQREFRCKGLA
ncbi:MAG: flagellar brake domain-containing protein [Halanaerobiales bacterium]|nr:flagellar brake domain-containing protein [Halanaerobiales bacterium]